MTNKQKNIEPFIMTYEDSLEIINEFLKENKKGKKFKAAVMMAQKALKNEIGRARRFETDLEDAESDYTRDFAAEQDLYGENADSFFGKVKADGFDIMEAFHDGAEWRREHAWHKADKKPFCDGALLVKYANGQYDITGYSELTWRTITKWAYIDELDIDEHN